MDRKLFVTLLIFSFVLFLFYLLFTIVSPFLAALGWGGAIGIITYPLYEKLLARLRGHESMASAAMTTLLFLSLILPLTGLVMTLSNEAAAAYQYLETAAAGTHISKPGDVLRHPAVSPLLDRIRPLTDTLNIDLDTMLVPGIKKGLSSLLNYSTGIVKNSFAFLIKLVIMMITLFFIYRDGKHFMDRFWRVVAISEQTKAVIIETINRVLGAVLYGIVLTCIIQGALGGLGFWAAGLPSPFLFGTLMAICAPIPLVGTALIWMPGAIYLLVQGAILKGVLLITWGVLVVSSIDNIIRPLVISGRAKLPILLIAIGVLGGVLAFGIFGVVAGPVVLALFVVFFEMYPEKAVQGAE